jgi:hypothetical protein
MCAVAARRVLIGSIFPVIPVSAQEAEHARQRLEGEDKEADELGAAFDVVDNWLGKEYAACRLDEDKKSESCVD